VTGTPLLVAQVATLLVFAGIFVGLILWLLRPGARVAARRHAEIPFREDPARTREDGPAQPGAPRP
jgi:cbb3-type cytochrome oxidase subunit 3